jgi:hypothetical protein
MKIKQNTPIGALSGNSCLIMAASTILVEINA